MSRRRFPRWPLYYAGTFVIAFVGLLFDRSWGESWWRRLAYLRHGARCRSLELRGRRAAWTELGEGPPVVLVHGLRAEIGVMLPLAEALAMRGWRAVLVDLPGHGASESLEAPLDIGTASSWLLELIAALELGERPPIVGHSMGGWITAWTALAHPEAVGPISLVCPGGWLFDPPPLTALLPSTAAEAEASLPLLFVAPPRVPRFVLRFASRRKREDSLGLMRSGMGGAFLLDGLLGGMAVPTQLVWGKEDRLIPSEVGAAMAAELGEGARHEELEGTGHMIVWERTVELARRIDAFLRDSAE